MRSLRSPYSTFILTTGISGTKFNQSGLINFYIERDGKKKILINFEPVRFPCTTKDGTVLLFFVYVGITL